MANLGDCAHGRDFGRREGFRLALDAYGDTFRASSTDLVRYRSRAALFSQEWALMQHRLPLLTQHYVGSAADIIELWTNEQPTYTSTFRAQAQDLSYRLASQFAER